MENRDRGSAAYYDILLNSTLFNKLRRIVWGYLPYLIISIEDESLHIDIEWRK
jgi:hypothetical protein